MSLPGLNIKDVVDNMVETLYGDYSQEKKDSLKEYYTTGGGSENVKKNIEAIQKGYKTAKDGLQSLSDSAAIVPSISGANSVVVVTVGQATSTTTPNPAWNTMFNKFAKGSLSSQASMVEKSLSDMLSSCKAISYEPPEQVLQLESTLKSVKDLINLIP